MNNDLIKILTTTELYKARVIEALLKENNIACHVLNKQDSTNMLIGEIEIYINEADKETALALIK